MCVCVCVCRGRKASKPKQLIHMINLGGTLKFIPTFQPELVSICNGPRKFKDLSYRQLQWIRECFPQLDCEVLT